MKASKGVSRWPGEKKKFCSVCPKAYPEFREVEGNDGKVSKLHNFSYVVGEDGTVRLVCVWCKMHLVSLNSNRRNGF